MLKVTLETLKFSWDIPIQSFQGFFIFIQVSSCYEVYVVSQKFFPHHMGFQLEFLTSTQYHPLKKTDNLSEQI